MPKKRVKNRSADRLRRGSTADTRVVDVEVSPKRVTKDSPVRGRFSRSQIRAAVEAVARRHSINEARE